MFTRKKLSFLSGMIRLSFCPVAVTSSLSVWGSVASRKKHERAGTTETNHLFLLFVPVNDFSFVSVKLKVNLVI